MNKIIKVSIEEPLPNHVLVQRENWGKPYLCVSTEKIYKRVRFFDEDGSMYVRDYTQEDWEKDTQTEEMHDRKGRFTYPLNTFILRGYLNYALEDVYIDEAIDDIKDGCLGVDYEDMSPACKMIIERLEGWLETDRKTPLNEFKCVCHKSEDDLGELYVIDYFNVQA